MLKRTELFWAQYALTFRLLTQVSSVTNYASSENFLTRSLNALHYSLFRPPTARPPLHPIQYLRQKVERTDRTILLSAQQGRQRA